MHADWTSTQQHRKPTQPTHPLFSVHNQAGVALPKISFSKYHGIGNDFILIDNRQSEKPLLSPEQCKQVGIWVCVWMGG